MCIRDRLQEVKQRFDIVLVDSPPILGVSDSAVLVSEVDMTLMVVQPRKLPLDVYKRLPLNDARMKCGCLFSGRRQVCQDHRKIVSSFLIF